MGLRSDEPLILILDARTRQAVGVCAGPDGSGQCPSFIPGQIPPCDGSRLLPLRSTPAAGLPFLVSFREGKRCPLAWLTARGTTNSYPDIESRAISPPGLAPRGDPSPVQVAAGSLAAADAAVVQSLRP